MSAHEEFQPGDRFLENFRIEGVLGHGGMGAVYLATDEWMERQVAIKLIQHKYADRPDFLERFRRETKALAKLEHRNIVRVYSAGRAPDGRLYMIMERLHGVTLRKIISAAGRLDLVSGIHYGLQIAEAVAIAHAKGILHRDIKPENIIIGPGGHLWVLDFGLAKSTASTGQTDEKKEMGTTRYMSPEQIHGHRADARADLYAIGIVLYEMFAGCHPYPAIDDDADISEPGILSAHLFAAARPLLEIVPDCPESVWDLIERCLVKDREARYPNADDLVTDLRAVLRESTPPDHPIAVRLREEQAEVARRRQMEARNQPPMADDEDEPSGAELAQVPTRTVPTEPLPADFVPVDPTRPLSPSNPPVMPQLGQGHTVKMPPPMASGSPSSWRAGGPDPSDATGPLPTPGLPVLQFASVLAAGGAPAAPPPAKAVPAAPPAPAARAQMPSVPEVKDAPAAAKAAPPTAPSAVRAPPPSAPAAPPVPVAATAKPPAPPSAARAPMSSAQAAPAAPAAAPAKPPAPPSAAHVPTLLGLAAPPASAAATVKAPAPPSAAHAPASSAPAAPPAPVAAKAAPPAIAPSAARAPMPSAPGATPAPAAARAPMPSAPGATPAPAAARAPMPSAPGAMPAPSTAKAPSPPAPPVARGPMPSAPTVSANAPARVPAASAPDAPSSYSFTSQSPRPGLSGASGAPQNGAAAPSKVSQSLAVPATAPPPQKRRNIFTTRVVAGLWIAVAACGLLMLVQFMRRSAAVDASQADTPAPSGAEPAAAEALPSSASTAEAAPAKASPAPPEPSASAATTEPSTSAVAAQPSTAAPEPPTPVAVQARATSEASPAPVAGKTSHPTAGASKPSSSRLSSPKAAPPPPAPAPEPPARAHKGRLWLDSDPAPASPSKGTPTKPSQLPTSDKGKGAKR